MHRSSERNSFGRGQLSWRTIPPDSLAPSNSLTYVNRPTDNARSSRGDARRTRASSSASALGVQCHRWYRTLLRRRPAFKSLHSPALHAHTRRFEERRCKYREEAWKMDHGTLAPDLLENERRACRMPLSIVLDGGLGTTLGG